MLHVHDCTSGEGAGSMGIADSARGKACWLLMNHRSPAYADFVIAEQLFFFLLLILGL